jgi:hypothetical protein
MNLKVGFHLVLRIILMNFKVGFHLVLRIILMNLKVGFHLVKMLNLFNCLKLTMALHFNSIHKIQHRNSLRLLCLIC